MITWIDFIGYIASALVALSFFSKMMIPLRIFALCSNFFFIAYGALTGSYPILFLHIFLLPTNTVRLVQIVRLNKKVKESATGECSIKCLVPFMTLKKYAKGELLFRKGDRSDRMFYISKGTVRLEEIDKTEGPGAVLGEFGVFSPVKERTLTAVCQEDCEIESISDDKILQIFYQNPRFGYFIIRLVISRHIDYTKQFH
jgi:hypothetical protein